MDTPDFIDISEALNIPRMLLANVKCASRFSLHEQVALMVVRLNSSKQVDLLRHVSPIKDMAWIQGFNPVIVFYIPGIYYVAYIRTGDSHDNYTDVRICLSYIDPIHYSDETALRDKAFEAFASNLVGRQNSVMDCDWLQTLIPRMKVFLRKYA